MRALLTRLEEARARKLTALELKFAAIEKENEPAKKLRERYAGVKGAVERALRGDLAKRDLHLGFEQGKIEASIGSRGEIPLVTGKNVRLVDLYLNATDTLDPWDKAAVTVVGKAKIRRIRKGDGSYVSSPQGGVQDFSGQPAMTIIQAGDVPAVSIEGTPDDSDAIGRAIAKALMLGLDHAMKRGFVVAEHAPLDSGGGIRVGHGFSGRRQ